MESMRFCLSALGNGSQGFSKLNATGLRILPWRVGLALHLPFLQIEIMTGFVVRPATRGSYGCFRLAASSQHRIERVMRSVSARARPALLMTLRSLSVYIGSATNCKEQRMASEKAWYWLGGWDSGAGAEWRLSGRPVRMAHCIAHRSMSLVERASERELSFASIG